MKIIPYIIFFISIYSLPAYGQKREKIKYEADELKFQRINKEPVRKLINNVIFIQGETEVRCDSANFYNKKNLMEAYGNVKIYNSDSSVITSNILIYDGNKKIAQLRGNVIYVKDQQEIKTQKLDYYIDEKKGLYFDGGSLKDETNNLQSINGIFFGDRNMSSFSKKVEFRGKDYIMYSDSMIYNTETKEATTFGFSEIISDDSVMINSLGGSYNESNLNTSLTSSTIETNEYILEADIISYNESEKVYEANQNVKLKIKDSDYYILGNSGIYDREKELTKIFDEPLLKKNIENDTFYLSSDTILAYGDNKDITMLKAYNNVKFYRSQFTGRSDSIKFSLSDSIITMFNDPVVWNGKNQISSDTINFILNENNIEEMNLIKNAFIISEDTLKNFNQIKGRLMKAEFDENNNIKSINVKGNGETIYYALDESMENMIGLNYIICSDLRLNFKENEISNIIFYKNPQAKLIPPHEISKDDQYIESFRWRESEKPTIQDVVYYLRKKIYLRNDK